MMTRTPHSVLRTVRKALILAPAVMLLMPALAQAGQAGPQTCQQVQISATQIVTVCETKRESTRKIMTATDVQPAQTRTQQVAPRSNTKTRSNTRKTWIAKGRAHQA